MRNTARMVSFGLFLVMLCFLTAGCYTVLKRPGSVIDEEGQALQEGYGSEQGVHPDDVWYDPFYYWYYPNSYNHWRYYYTYPWWWNDYWFWDSGTSQSGEPVSTDRHIWDDRRSPDWSTPPSSSTPSSPPSQPKSETKQSNQPTDSSPEDQLRRKPDWNKEQDDRSDSDLEQKRRQMGEDGEADR